MIATSGFLTASECTKFVLDRGSAPDSAGELTVLPESLAGLRGPTSKGRGKMGGEGWEDKGRGEGRGRKGSQPPYANSWILHCFMLVVSIPQAACAYPPLSRLSNHPRLSRHLKLTVHTRVLEFSTRYSIQSRVVIKLLNSGSRARGGRS